MFRLTIEKEAQNDLKALIAAGEEGRTHALRILAILEDVKASQSLLSALLDRGFSNDEFNVDKFVELFNAGFNIWRIALFRVGFGGKRQGKIPYRIIYGYDESCRTFRVLGVLPRDFDYDPEHELCKRILRSYNNLGLPKYRASHSSSRRYGPH